MKTKKTLRRAARESVAFEWRPAGALLTAHSPKTHLGESLGWVTGMLYLAPHTIASEKSLCPYSTAACRRDCLYSSGLGGLPRAVTARETRTALFHDDRDAFLSKLALEMIELQHVALKHGLGLAIRLNGTSDIMWERQRLDAAGGKTLMAMFPSVRFYDYTKVPLQHRDPPSNYHLTYSLADDNWDTAVAYLLAGQSVAAVMRADEIRPDGSWFSMGDRDINVVDGDAHDLRFLDPPGSLVQLKPKGSMTEGSPMVRPRLVRDLMRAALAPHFA